MRELPLLSNAFQRLYCDPAAFASFSSFHPISFARVLPFQSQDRVVDDHRLIYAEEAHLADRSDETRRRVVDAYLRCGLVQETDARNLKSAIDFFEADFFDLMGLGLNDQLPGLGKSVADELLTPTRIYVKSILNLLRDFQINGIAHITGGGLLENVPRVLPNGCKAVIGKDSWQVPPLFRLLQDGGNIDDDELLRTFNCGIGMVLAVPEADADEIMIRLSGLNEQAVVIGEIAKCEPGKECVEMV